MTRRIALVVAALAALAGPGGCAREGAGPAEMTTGGVEPGRDLLERGRETYALYCIGCHGETGDGNGAAARFLDPKPRDFRRGRVKFAAVAAGSTPREEDLLRTVTNGLHGTAMSSFRLLPLADRRALVAYVETLFEGERAADVPLPIPLDPWEKEPARGVAEGERLYHGLAGCWNCHPAYVSRAKIAAHTESFGKGFGGYRDDLFGAPAKESDWGAPIRPTDFLFDRIKTGDAPADLVVVIAAGIGGTAMPSWGYSLDDKQLWGLAHYIASLARVRGSPEAFAMHRALLASDTSTPTPR